MGKRLLGLAKAKVGMVFSLIDPCWLYMPIYSQRKGGRGGEGGVSPKNEGHKQTKCQTCIY